MEQFLITNPPAELFLQNWYFEKKNQENIADAVPSKVMELFQQAVDTEKEQIGEITLQGHYWVMIVSPLYSHQNHTWCCGCCKGYDRGTSTGQDEKRFYCQRFT